MCTFRDREDWQLDICVILVSLVVSNCSKCLLSCDCTFTLLLIDATELEIMTVFMTLYLIKQFVIVTFFRYTSHEPGIVIGDLLVQQSKLLLYLYPPTNSRR